ncbi:hypothetical protein B0H11DRAFT_1842918 [Mycena galericulata]|nr:hypothetical protein B0H11DRAFT_1842918 [Mycena galericulata]
MLPAEIVDEIFVRCLSIPDVPPNSWTWTSFPLEQNRVPLLLSSICRTWRAIAVSSPHLWTSLILDLEVQPPDSQVTSTRVALCQRWLSRSGDLPLHLYLRYNYVENTYSSDRDPLLELFRRFSSRWRTLNISLQLPDYHRLCERLEGRLQLLETLSINIVEGGNQLQWLTVFRSAPALQNLSVVTPGWMLFRAQDLPLAQLRRFHGVRSLFAWTVLIAAPGLEECSISLDRESERETGLWLLTFPRLRSFRLLHGERHGRYLDFFALPALETLELTLGSEDVPAFREFITRSSCALRALRLVLREGLTTDALRRCFALTPSLTELSMDLRSCDTVAPDGVLPCVLGGELLPQLTALTIHVKALHDIVDDGLVERLTSILRRESGFRRFSVDADGGPAPGDEVIQSLNALGSTGMSVEVCVGGRRLV